MRAGMVLQALTKRFAVHVLLVPLGSRPAHRTLPDQFDELRSRFLAVEDTFGVLAPRLRWGRDAGDAAVNAFVEETLLPWRQIQFDAVHIYRLLLAPFARAAASTIGRLPPRFCGVIPDQAVQPPAQAAAVN